MDFNGLPSGGNESTDNTAMNLLIATFSTTTDTLVAAYALSIVIANGIILMTLSRLILILRNRRENNGTDLVINLFFVCLNDTLCGLALLFFTAIQLDGTITGHLCAYTVILCLSLLTTSQGNIICICIQRFMTARNLHKVTKDRQTLISFTLLFVNILVGTTSYILTVLQAKVYKLRTPSYSVCDFMTVLGPSAEKVNFTFYWFQLTTTIVADILCLVTMVILWRKLNSVVNSDISNSHVESQSSQSYLSVKRRQQKAVVTLALVLVFFNVSMLPHLVLTTLLSLGVPNKLIPPRFAFLFLFVNSLINPFIIMTRMEDIRREIHQLFATVKNKVLSCL